MARHPVDMRLAGTDIGAVSVGGLETCIEVPSWKLCFDIGRCPPTAVRLKRVLFTHAHIDHMGGVAHHTGIRDLWGMKPPEYVVPSEYVDDFQALLAQWRKLARSSLPCKVRSVEPGSRFSVGKGKVVRAFRSVHRAPTLGYALMRVQRELLPAFRGLPGPELAARREAGETLEREVETPEVAFCGDTTIDVVEREALVRTARLLVLEVTFLDDAVPADVARKKGHVHLDHVIERAELFENRAILFTHISQRYAPGQIRRILDERLPDSLKKRVTPLMPRPPWGG